MSCKKLSLTTAENKEANKIFGSFNQRGFSVKKDKDGFFIYTRRARSKSYRSLKSIPKSVQNFIRSTG